MMLCVGEGLCYSSWRGAHNDAVPLPEDLVSCHWLNDSILLGALTGSSALAAQDAQRCGIAREDLGKLDSNRLASQ